MTFISSDHRIDDSSSPAGIEVPKEVSNDPARHESGDGEQEVSTSGRTGRSRAERATNRVQF